MEPISPVIPGAGFTEVVFSEGQSEYVSLPAIRNADPEGMVTTHWRLTWRERLQVLLRGDLWLQVLTFHNSLQPIRLATKCPQVIKTAEADRLKAGGIRAGDDSKPA